ncbi:hypothetical protein PISMIDRAFT_690053 [Pisolithus microcarpus 441]|uniref:Unplaced genomic scaffold scaffold_475, whole genome shotgun sequence n=1 Tax=Pisolithus microcarpus 441 TaxID=765257 RepID=A0A0C9Y3V9_9AGAM|nr:hypothetical protein BKA83DRAFT_690053 [Pisolithus microcarpus]KIK11776.1 hypothetical protein PISMIDRAFT_690053 [Pisolithus microcarpus 441]
MRLQTYVAGHLKRIRYFGLEKSLLRARRVVFQSKYTVYYLALIVDVLVLHQPISI